MIMFVAGFITCIFTLLSIALIKDAVDEWRAARDYYE